MNAQDQALMYAHTLLEQIMLNETPCQSAHALPNNRACSREVTHLHKSCHGEALVCGNHYLAKRADMETGLRCAHCDQPSIDCWTFRKV